jgi:hypothetical protein
MISLLGGLLLALVLLCLALAPSLINSLADLRGLASVHRFATTPGGGSASLPTAERTRGDTVQKQDIPTVASAGLVVWNAEPVDGAISYGKPVE